MPRDVQLVMMADRWRLPPPVLAYHLEYSGWSAWYDLAAQVYGIQSKHAADQQRRQAHMSPRRR